MIAIACSFPTARAQEYQTQLSLEFLEYLAEMEQVDGDWVDAADVTNQKTEVLQQVVKENESPEEKTVTKQSDQPEEEEDR